MRKIVIPICLCVCFMSCKIINSTAPSDVTGVKVYNTGDLSVTFKWTDPADSDLSAIEVICVSSGTTVKVDPGVQTCTIVAPHNSVPYGYTITAVDWAGNKSSGVSRKTTAWRPEKKISQYGSTGALDFYYVVDYDTNGFWSRYTCRAADDSLSYYMTYEYDSMGLLTKFADYNSTETLDQYWVYNTSSTETSCRYDRYNGSDVFKGYEVIEYNADGIYVKDTMYDSSGTATFCWVHELDSNGCVIKKSTYSNGILNSYQLQTLDSYGVSIRADCYDSSGTLTGWSVMEYNADGSMTKKTDYSAAGTMSGYDIYEYN